MPMITNNYKPATHVDAGASRADLKRGPRKKFRTPSANEQELERPRGPLVARQTTSYTDAIGRHQPAE